ncbi:WD40 repeat protein [Thiogranum longum]|uniref:WD40 repeat protein n=1 Tax=Thiogranum longum TaxID=1537524 RepID=A0A4R1HEX8_9GAMM|nr:PD40 domain-containing protein [Thiogranum longum]TCK18885.1 WD40 repeat protein [Thiogranum longum]
MPLKPKRIHTPLRIAVLLLLLLPLKVFSANEKIAYLAHSKNFWQVWTMQADGTDPQQITHTPFDKSHISWYPDGTHLLVNGSQGQIRKVNVQTKQETILELPIKGTVDAVVSPDGLSIAFSLSVAGSIDNNHIWLVKEDGSGLKKLTAMKGLQHEPVWSRDGKAVYFLSGEGDQSHDVWRVERASKRIEKLTAGKLYHFDMAFANDNAMAFSNNQTGNYEIWIKQSDGSNRQLTQHESIDARPSWSPDGKAIVFESSRSGVMNIWMKPISNSEAVQLTHEKVGARFPVWSAGGPEE